MSKYVAIVNLEDDARCDGCPFTKYAHCESEYPWATCTQAKRALPDYDSDQSGVRPAWCPLCPVYSPEVIDEEAE